MNFIIWTLIGCLIGLLISYSAYLIFRKSNIAGIQLNNIAISLKKKLKLELPIWIQKNIANPDSIIVWVAPEKQTENLKPFIETHIEHFLNHKLQEKVPAIALLVGPPTLLKIKEGILDEYDTLAPKLIKETIIKNHNIEGIQNISFRIIDALNDSTIENLSNNVLQKIKQYLLIMGLSIGAIVGLLMSIVQHTEIL